MHANNIGTRVFRWPILALLGILVMSTSAFAQGSIYGIVANSDLSTPANGEITFVGYLDDTDEEIRIETSDGAGYDAGNWFDDFQNYLTEAPGNPYDYHFFNTANGQAFQLSKTIPNNSFQEENVLLAAASWPPSVTGFSGQGLSGSSVMLNWNGTVGITYHVYRRQAVSNGSFFRIDDPTGSLANPGVADSIFIDNTVDGVSSYDYLVIAEDGVGTLSPHSTVLTVNSAVLAAPVLASIDPNNGVVQGGLLINLYGSSFDPAGVDIQFGAQVVAATVVSPYHLTMVTPASTAGAIDVSVTNTASALASNILVGGFTYNPNSAPTLAAIGAQSITEGLLLQFTATATDPDGDTPVMTSTALPGLATYVDNGDGTGTFNWTPDFVEAGIYNVTFYATDAVISSLVDSEQVVITVNEAGNQTPILAAVGPQSTTENTQLLFAVSASDPDATIPTLTTSTLPGTATFIDNGDGTGSFDWTPSFIEAGIHNVTFYASDGTATDSEQVVITVNEAGNQIPVLAAIGPQAAAEGVLMTVNVTATDAEGIPALTTSTLPTGALFTDNADGTGALSWTPDFTQAGIYDISFYASDGVDTDSELVTITVSESGNQTPLLAAIGAQSTTENVQLTFGVSASDPDGTIPVLSTSALPGTALFTDNGDGTGAFDWTPGFVDAGTYNVTFYASDGSATDSEQVVITVNEAGNQLPVLAAIGAQSIDENVLLSFAVSATDAEGIPTLSTSAVPTGALFTDNGDGTGSFDWTPDFTQAGAYDVSFYASDGVDTDSELVTITVLEVGNQTPTLATIGAQGVVEDVQLLFVVTASDPDGTIPALSTSVLPGTALFTDNGDGTGSFDWTPSFTDAGTHNVTFYATDDFLALDSEVIVITVNEAGNQLPVLAAIGAQSTDENLLLSFSVSATDAESIPTLTTSAVPTGALFTDNGDGTGSFDWTPSFTDAGTHNVTFYATDDFLAVDSEVIVITVNEAGNQIPVLAAIGAQSTDENLLLSFAVSATDAEDIPTLSTSAVPTGALFTDNGDGTGSFDWTPDFTQAGSYDVSFYASDGIDTDSELVTITVLEVGNQAPVLATIGAQGVVEDVQLLFVVTASDPDGTIPALSTSVLPGTALFTDNGDGTGSFDWTPSFTDAGTHNVTFYVYDGALTDSEVVTITVADAGDQPPVLAAIGPQIGTENVLLTILVTATDPEGTTPILSAANLPTGALFTDNTDGTGSFDWTPDFIQAGVYDVTFFASDGVQLDSEVVTITINEAGNQPPVLATIGNQVTVEGAQLLIPITATDAESIPSILADSLPVGAVLVDNLDGTATFDWTPGFTEAGSYNVLFYATDGLLADSELVTITVSEAGAQAPVVTAVSDTSVLEGNQIVLSVSAFDPDGGAVFITANHNLNNFVFVDSGNGMATLTYSPDFFDAGIDSIVFLATDFDTPQQSGSAITVLTTIEVNQAPAFVPMMPLAVEINKTLIATVVAHDSTDANILHLLYMSATGLPANASFVDNGNKTGTLTFTPQPGQEGVYTITFIVTDQGSPQLSASMPIDITVQAVNTPPVLSPIGPQTVLEGEVLTINLSAADPDGNIPWFTADTSNLEGNATFVDNGDGTAVFTFSPNFVQAGLSYVEFYAHDGIDYTKENVLIQIYEAGDQAPRFDPLPSPSVVEADTGFAVITAYDPDGLSVTISLVDSLLPPNFTFVDSGNGVAILEMRPDYVQSGIYIITLTVDDGTLQSSDDLIVNIVDAGNQVPMLSPVADQVVNEGGNLTFPVYGVDVDGVPSLVLTSPDMPIIPFIDHGDGSGTFNWTPGNFDAGIYTAIFYAIDDTDPLLYDSAVITIQVNDINVPPNYFIPPNQQDTLEEGSSVYFTIWSFDADSTFPTITPHLDGFPDSLPPNMALDSNYIDAVNGWRVGVLRFSPDFTQGSTPTPTFYQIHFTICDEMDPGLCVEATPVTFRVYNINQVPQMIFSSGSGPFTLAESQTLSFTVSATDDNGLVDSLVVLNLPTNATFSGMQFQKDFVFTPDFTQSGQYQVSFAAYDNQGLADTVIVEINVTDAGNQAPIISTVVPDTIDVIVGVLSQTVIDATDPDLDVLTMTANLATASLGFAWSGTPGTASGTLSCNADISEAGLLLLAEIIVSDPGGAADTVSTFFRVFSTLRGDVDSDNRHTMNDIVYLINYLFEAGPEPSPLDAGDVNKDGLVNVADISYLVNFLYNAGPPPPQ